MEKSVVYCCVYTVLVTIFALTFTSHWTIVINKETSYMSCDKENYCSGISNSSGLSNVNVGPFVQQIQLFHKIGQQGDGIIYKREANVTWFHPIKSICFQGIWQYLMSDGSYGIISSVIGSDPAIFQCFDVDNYFSNKNVSAVRYLGTSVYPKASLTIMEKSSSGSDSDADWGDILYYDNLMWTGNNYSVSVLSVVLTGFSNWTIFSNLLYTGTTQCLSTKQDFEVRDLGQLTSIGSVVRGCDTN